MFLDLDGTLLEIAASPEAVVVPPDLVPLLSHLAVRLGGALALVSGRPIREVDRLLGTNRFPVAGLHGLEWRDVAGETHVDPVANLDLREARDAFAAMARRVDGVRFEDKGRTVALHYREAPEAEADVRAVARALAKAMGAGVALQEGKMVVELKPAGATKGTAVTRFMEGPPFAGRVPVYVGDDVTDEDAFEVVNAMGGHTFRVGEGETRARHVLTGVNDVYVWLDQIVSALPASRGPHAR